MSNYNDLKAITIENFLAKNRDLKNLRTNVTIGILAIIVAFGAILATIISPILNSTKYESAYLSSGSGCEWTCITLKDHPLWFIFSNIPFNSILVFGVLISIILLLILLFILSKNYDEEIENCKELSRFLQSSSFDSLDYYKKEYRNQIIEEKENDTKKILLSCAGLWIFGAIGLNKIIPIVNIGIDFKGIISIPIQEIACPLALHGRTLFFIFCGIIFLYILYLKLIKSD